MITLQKTSQCKAKITAEENFLSEFNERKNNEGDIILSVDGETTSTHRKVLMASSEYFKTMFTSAFLERTAKSIDLSDTIENIEILNKVIDCMYTGNIDLSGDNIEAMLAAACHFLIDGLRNACACFLQMNLSPETCIPIWILAEQYNLSHTEEIAFEIIKTWFPFGLYNEPPALALPKHYMCVLIEKGILDKLPQVVRSEYLGKWLEHYMACGGNEKDLPQLLLLDLNTRITAAENKEKQETGKSLESMLFAVHTPPPSNMPESCYAEVHVYVPQTKIWLSVMRHTFGDDVKADAVPHIVGLTEEKAYFLFFRDCSRFDNMKEYLISVTLDSGSEEVINLPEDTDSACQSGSRYFIFDGVLHAILQDNDHSSRPFWGIQKYEGAGKWRRVSEMDCGYTMDFLTFLYNGAVYIWCKEYLISGSAHCGTMYFLHKLSKSSDGVYEIEKLESLCEGDLESCDFPEDDYSEFANISVDDARGIMSFTHRIFDHDEDGEVNQTMWGDQKYRVYNYDINADDWREHAECTLRFPDQVSRTAKPKARSFNLSGPQIHPCMRLAVRDKTVDRYMINTDVDRDYPEAAIGALYYLKTTSPYNTTMWMLDIHNKQWTEASHLPYSLDRFPFFQLLQLNPRQLTGMPISCFMDISKDIGQSAIAELELSAAGLELMFDSDLLLGEDYDKAWGSLLAHRTNVS